jgi:hypothetical protein
LLGRSTPDYIAIVGRDGIAMAAQGCNNPTTLGLDHAASSMQSWELVECCDAQLEVASPSPFTDRCGSTT